MNFFKMKAQLFLVCVCFLFPLSWGQEALVSRSTWSWSLPKRCHARKFQPNRTPRRTMAPVVPSIEELALQQQDRMGNLHKSHEILSVEPIRAHLTGNTTVVEYTAYDCHFRTGFRRLASRVCTDKHHRCYLSDLSSPAESYYQALGGYMWGASVISDRQRYEETYYEFRRSNVLSLVMPTGYPLAQESSPLTRVEVVGSPTPDREYKCTDYPDGATTRVVECFNLAGQTGKLQMYKVQTDMECHFGELTLEADTRDGKQQVLGWKSNLTEYEIQDLLAAALFQFEDVNCTAYRFDMNRISSSLLWKLTKMFPCYAPLTDLIWIGQDSDAMWLGYFKLVKQATDLALLMPFTNLDETAEEQYACTFESDRTGASSPKETETNFL